jgi:WD40 repeat protein
MRVFLKLKAKRGRGQAVLTASRAGEYSFEGQALPGATTAGSVFTAGLVEGLRTGAADTGGDGYVSVDEAFAYASDYVARSRASQTPQLWLSGGEGAIVLARSPAGRVITPAAPPKSAQFLVLPSRLAHELGGYTSRWFSTPTVDDVAFSPDGRLLATGQADKTAQLWDPATGKHLRTLTGHDDRVWGVAFSPDGRLLAISSWDKTARLWDPATGKHLRTLTGHDDEVVGVAFSPDGRLLATTSRDKTARLWDPATGEPLRTLTGHDDAVVGVAFSPDGRLLATGSRDQTARLWDPATGEPLRTLTGHAGAVVGVAFSPDGRLLATASQDATARLWD